MLREAGVPSVLRGGFEWPSSRLRQENSAALLAWRGRPTSVLLMGATGVGKSMLAAELLWGLVSQRGGRGVWTRASAVPGLRFDGRDAHLAQAGSVVCDEFGRAHEAPAAWEAVCDLLCERHDQGRPTVLTTNRALEDLAARDLAGALMDRLQAGLIVEIAGESRR